MPTRINCTSISMTHEVKDKLDTLRNGFTYEHFLTELTDLAPRINSRKRPGQSFTGAIAELLDLAEKIEGKDGKKD